MADEPGPANRRSRGRLLKPLVWIGQGVKGVGSLLAAPRSRRGRGRLPLASLSSGFLPAQNMQHDEVDAHERPPPETSGQDSLHNPFEAFAAWTATLQLPWQQGCQQLGQDSSSSGGTAVDGTLMLDISGTFPLVMSSPLSRPRSVLAHHPAAATSACQQQQQPEQQRQQLLTVGSRMWGNWWDGRGLLRVKIYDFAIYVDGHSAHAQVGSSAGKRSLIPRVLQRKQRRAARLAAKHAAQAAAPAGEGCDDALQQDSAAERAREASSSVSSASDSGAQLQQQQPRRRARRAKASAIGGAGAVVAVAPSMHSLAARLMASSSSSSGGGGQQFVPMSLVLRASRDIPLATLASEYQRVLERRICKVGGNPQDPDLSALVATFAPSRVPRPVRHGPGSVARGTMMTFERGSDGALTARVGPHVLGVFSSPKLCEALFDLYLGENPVSKKAKVAAGDTLARLSRSSDELYRPQSSAERIKCSGPDLSACVLELKD